MKAKEEIYKMKEEQLLKRRNRRNCKYFLPHRNYWRLGRCKRKLPHHLRRGTHFCIGVNCGDFKTK